MIEMEKINGIWCTHVISEPGDGTRYDFIVGNDGPDRYCFMPHRSTFRFPQKINYYDVCNIEEINDTILEFAKNDNCNPHTVLECVRIIKKLRE